MDAGAYYDDTLQKSVHCKSRPSQYELHIPWKELDLFVWGRQSWKLVWYVSTKNFCFSFAEICRSNVIVHLRTVNLFNVNYKLLYRSIFVCKELSISFFLWEQSEVCLMWKINSFIWNILNNYYIFPFSKTKTGKNYIFPFLNTISEELKVQISESLAGIWITPPSTFRLRWR